MDTTSPELAAALLQWVNTFELSAQITSWEELADGVGLWTMLSDIDPEYFHGDLPETDRKTTENWIPRWQNWKHIERAVTTYIREECDKLHELSRELKLDLKAIATNGSAPDIIKLVKCVLLAAMYSPHSNERMVQVMQNLGAKVAQPIAIWIGEMEEMDQSMREYGDTEPSSEIDYSTDSEAQRGLSIERDPELEREEKLIQALQEKKRLEARLADALADLEEVREKCTSLEDELAESKFALDRRRGTTQDDKNLAQLNQRADRDKEYIAELESELASSKTTIEEQETQLEQLKADGNSRQELRDELQLITAERDELRQKSKVNENLKKKIQTLQEQDKSNTSLRHDLQTAQEQLQDLEDVRERCTALEKANEENAQTIANGEQEIFDQKTAKKRLEHELKLVAQKWEQSRDLLTNAQETIRDLEDKLHDSHSGEGREGGAGSLDDELNAESGTPERKDKEIKKKPKEPTTTAEGIVLQQNLNIANASIARLEQRCLDLLQENLGFKSIIDETEDNKSSVLHPFQVQARKIESMTQELDEVKGKFLTASNEVTDLTQRLAAASGKAVGGDALAIKENQDRQDYINDLQATVHDQRGLLRHALLSPQALQLEGSKIRSMNEYKLIRQQLEVINKTPAAEADPIIKTTATSITDRIESARGGLAEKEKLLAERTTEFTALQAELEAIKSKPPPVPAKDPVSDSALQKELERQQRENKLIASAWYDLTCRLQSNTVLLARRAEGGRSWLGRMRTAVNSTSNTTGNAR